MNMGGSILISLLFVEHHCPLGSSFQGEPEWHHHRLQDPLQAKVVSDSLTAHWWRPVKQWIDRDDRWQPAFVYRHWITARHRVPGPCFCPHGQRIGSHDGLDDGRDVRKRFGRESSPRTAQLITRYWTINISIKKRRMLD